MDTMALEKANELKHVFIRSSCGMLRIKFGEDPTSEQIKSVTEEEAKRWFALKLTDLKNAWLDAASCLRFINENPNMYGKLQTEWEEDFHKAMKDGTTVDDFVKFDENYIENGQILKERKPRMEEAWEENSDGETDSSSASSSGDEYRPPSEVPETLESDLNS